MQKHEFIFKEENVIHHLKHYLPAQAALKDFIHHNTLHAFQDRKFYDAITQASQIFGYKTSLSLVEYRDLFSQKKISEATLEKVILDKKGQSNCRQLERQNDFRKLFRSFWWQKESFAQSLERFILSRSRSGDSAVFIQVFMQLSRSGDCYLGVSGME
jgi:hypothetical protein